VNTCYLCGKPLSEDPRERCFGISEEEMEKRGLMDSSEIGDNDAVIVLVCLACGFDQGLPTVQELKDLGAEMEAGEPKN
jgi:hypothetical protein